jgi:putative membrane protein
LQDAIQGDLSEIQIGMLAEQNGSSEEARNFGATLVSDHTANLTQAEALAQSMGVTVPTQPNAEQQANYQQLSGLSGTEFDAQFAQSMVVDHVNEIAQYAYEGLQNDAVGDFARQSLPALDEHLDLAESLSASTASSSSTSSSDSNDTNGSSSGSTGSNTTSTESTGSTGSGSTMSTSTNGTSTTSGSDTASTDASGSNTSSGTTASSGAGTNTASGADTSSIGTTGSNGSGTATCANSANNGSSTTATSTADSTDTNGSNSTTGTSTASHSLHISSDDVCGSLAQIKFLASQCSSGDGAFLEKLCSMEIQAQLSAMGPCGASQSTASQPGVGAADQSQTTSMGAGMSTLDSMHQNPATMPMTQVQHG